MRGTCLLLICLWVMPLEAQHIADSVVASSKGLTDSSKARVYLDVAARIQNKDHTNCIRLCNEVLQIAKSTRRRDLAAEANFLKGLTYYFAGTYDSTLALYLLAIRQFDSVRHYTGMGKVHNELGIFYRKQNNSGSALQSFKDAYRLGEKGHDAGVMGTALNNQGILAQDAGDHAHALDLFKQAQAIYRSLGDSIGISYTLDYSSVSYAALGSYKQADSFQLQALEMRLRLNDSNAAALSLINLAEFALLQQNDRDLERYLFRCLGISEKIQYKDLSAYAYKLLSEMYHRQGRDAQAYDFHVKYTALNEEIFNEKSRKQVNELQAKYETEKRLQQIQILTRENELKEQRNRNQRNVLLSLLAFLVLVSVAWYLYFSRKKQQEKDLAIILEKEQANKAIIEAEEKERLRIARDLHDGVAQTMTAAKMQLEYFLDERSKKEQLSPALQNAFDLISDAAKEVRSVSHSMIPNALLKSGLVAAVRDFVQRMGSEKMRINLVVLGLNERLPENIETIVFRVLQELVNNIVKHAAATEVTIQLIREEALLTLMVEDNGKGFDIHENKQGIGLQNISSRVEYLAGSTHFDSSPGKGTTVIAEIPL